MFKDKKIPSREKRKSLFYKFEVLNLEDKFIGFLGDITLSGLKVISEESMQLNSNHNLKIKLPPRIGGKEEIAFEAECVWCKNDEDNKDYQLGFKAHHENAENINTIKIIMELLASPEDLIL
jgi:PilZ domain-containing protein